MPRLYVSNGRTTVSIFTQMLPLGVPGETAVVSDVIADAAARYGFIEGNCSLHLPAGVSLPPLPEDEIDNRVNVDGSLRPGLLLTKLGLVGQDDTMPLIIKAETPEVLETFVKDDKRSKLIESLQPNGTQVPLFGRSEQLQQLKDLFGTTQQKTHVAVLCSTRGMGKTTLLKALIDPEGYGIADTKIPQLDEARAIGRLAVVDLTTLEHIAAEENYASSLWVQIIIRHLFKIFDGCSIEMNGVQYIFNPDNFHSTVKKLKISYPGNAFDRWKDLTNAAYGVGSNAKPVILLDEIGWFMEETKVLSSQTAGKYHTKLSRALSHVGNRAYIVVAGTRDGDLDALASYSSFYTVNIPLRPLSLSDVYAIGNFIGDQHPIGWPADEYSFKAHNGLMALFSQTLYVPRLIALAFGALINASKVEVAGDPYLHIMGVYEMSVLLNYKDVAQNFAKYSNAELIHILLVCASGFQVRKNQVIPGTNLTIESAVDKALLFPYNDDRYVTSPMFIEKHRRSELSSEASNLIPGVDLDTCFFQFNIWLTESLNLYSIGIRFETIFAHSLCISYYLRRLLKLSGSLKFTDIYSLPTISPSFAAASKLEIDISNGYRSTTGDESHANCFCHNRESKNARFDAKVGEHKFQMKYSMGLAIDGGKAGVQVKYSKNSTLIWVQLGIDEDSYRPKFKNQLAKEAWESGKLVVINGRGCCSPLVLDLLYNLKSHLKTATNQDLVLEDVVFQEE